MGMTRPNESELRESSKRSSPLTRTCRLPKPQHCFGPCCPAEPACSETVPIGSKKRAPAGCTPAAPLYVQ